MPSTYVIYTGDGVTTNFPITFTYLDDEFVKVSVDGVDTPFTFLSEFVAQLAPAPANGAVVRVYRQTKSDSLIVTIPSSGVIKGASINAQSQQALDVAQEGSEALIAAMAEDFAGNLDAAGRKIVNLVAPTDAQDAATKGYVDTKLSADIATITAAKNAATAAASGAATSEFNAASSASAAAASASSAAASEAAALASKNAAATSASSAASSASTATTGASTATTKASQASTSAAAAAASETNAGNSETAAAASASAAASSASSAATSASAADTSETNAAASETLAEKWATEAENVPVTTGLFSAYHWAQKAAASAAGMTPVEDQIVAATAKATPVDADVFGYVDSAASWALKKMTWANLKAALKTYFDTLYSATGHTHASATTGAAGFMSAADKTKLNAVGTMANRNITISTSNPSGGSNGDIWLKV